MLEALGQENKDTSVAFTYVGSLILRKFDYLSDVLFEVWLAVTGYHLCKALSCT